MKNPKRDVYDPEQFWYRVEFLAHCIVNGSHSRSADTCGEMGDGQQVCEALRRRVEKNPDSQLAANIWSYLSHVIATDHCHQIRHDGPQAARAVRPRS